jgi:hypothetical protein
MDVGDSHELELDLSIDSGFALGRRDVADR